MQKVEANDRKQRPRTYVVTYGTLKVHSELRNFNQITFASRPKYNSVNRECYTFSADAYVAYV